MQQKLAVVIPVYNHVILTSQTIDSLVACTKSDLTVIIVDDCSSDDTHLYCTEVLQEMFAPGKFLYHRHEVNKGVNAAWNSGLRIAMSSEIPYICIANNDLIFTDGWDIPLVDALKNDGYALVSPYSTEQKKPDDFPLGSTRHPNPMGLAILGACFMFNRELIHQIGYFPEDMVHYYGDNWILKMCDARGLPAGHIQASYIHHKFCMTSSELDNAKWFNEDREAYNRYLSTFDLDIEDAYQFAVSHEGSKEERSAFYANRMINK